jgi:hypothetical protein
MVLKTTCFDLSRSSSGPFCDEVQFMYWTYMVVVCLSVLCVLECLVCLDGRRLCGLLLGFVYLSIAQGDANNKDNKKVPYFFLLVGESPEVSNCFKTRPFSIHSEPGITDLPRTPQYLLSNQFFFHWRP